MQDCHRNGTHQQDRWYTWMADVAPGSCRPGLATAAAVDEMLVILPTHELLIRTTDDVDNPLSISLALATLLYFCTDLQRYPGRNHHLALELFLLALV